MGKPRGMEFFFMTKHFGDCILNNVQFVGYSLHQADYLIPIKT